MVDSPFDRNKLRQNRNRSASGNLSESRFLIDWAGKQLISRLSDIKRNFPTALQIGLRNENKFSERAIQIAGIKSLFKIDLAENLVQSHKGLTLIGDEELLPIAPKSLDLALSVLNLHSNNDLPGTLIQTRKALKPDGLFLAALFGGETLHELRESLMQAELSIKGGASPRVLPFADKQQMGALLQRAGFALPVVDSDIVTVTYDNMFGLMKDIRGMGEGNIMASCNKNNPGRNFFSEAARYYTENFSETDGRIKASFEVIFLIGWSPHKSQQQPLQPGSASHNLADVLNNHL